MNIQGRLLLGRLGFNPPIKEVIVTYGEISHIDLERFYQGNRCGASIEVAPIGMKLSDGPNPNVKLNGEHNIPRDEFYSALDKVIGNAKEKGYLPSQLLFAICHSVPHSATMSGICARAERNGEGYLACELLNGARNGDFNPDYSVHLKIAGGRPMGHTRQISTTKSIPSWAVARLYDIMKKVNTLGPGMVGAEFVLDKQSQGVIFHDLYCSPEPTDNLMQKFHLA